MGRDTLYQNRKDSSKCWPRPFPEIIAERCRDSGKSGRVPYHGRRSVGKLRDDKHISYCLKIQLPKTQKNIT